MNERTKQRWGSAWLWAFPLALWLVSTGALFVWDLGKYSDDWAVNLRVPETDAYAWPGSPWERWNYFWRPLHLIAVYGLGTAFWHHDWVNHLISALAHLGVAALLWRLLRTLGASRAATSAAVCVFVTFPISYEAVLWPAALGSVVSVGWFLLIALMCVRLARIERVLTRGEAVRWFLALAGMAFLCASWHEQGAACVAALPLLMMAARGSGSNLRVTMRRAVLATGASVAGCLVYIALLMGTAPRGKRGSAGSLVEVDDVGERAAGFLKQVGEWLWGGKMEVALREMGHRGAEVLLSGVAGWIAIGVLATTLVGWALWGLNWNRRGVAESVRRDGRGWWVAAFGVVIGVASLLPVALVRQNFVFGRYFYAVGLGVALIIGGAEIVVRARAARAGHKDVEILFLLFGGMGGVVFAFAGVGWQCAYRETALRDAAIGEQLQRVAPTPVADAVFVPIESTNMETRSHVRGALEHPWSSWAFIQRTYGRGDLSATHWRSGARAPVTFDGRGVTYARGIADWKGRIAEAPSFVPRERVVAFTVDERGQVRILDWNEARRLAGGE